MTAGIAAFSLTTTGISVSVHADDDIWECTIPWPSIGDTPAGMTDVENAINKIVESKIGVHVTLYPIYCYDLTSQQTLAISSGDKLDLCLMMFETNAKYVSNGSIIDLTELYDKYGQNIKEKIGDAVKATTMDGHIYSIPEGGVSGEGRGYLFRTDLLEKYGFSTEDRSVTVEEMEKICQTLKEGEGKDFYPIAGTLKENDFFQFDELGTSSASGVVFFDEPDNVVDLYESDEYKNYAQTAYQWAQNGWIAPDASSSDTTTDLVKSGHYAGQESGMLPGQTAWYEQNTGYKTTALTVVEPYTKTSLVNGVSWGITSNCDNPEKAMEFLNLMYEDGDIGTLLTNGIEGVDYVVVDEDEDGNKIVDYPEGMDTTTIPYYNMFGVWPNTPIRLAPSDVSIFKETIDFNKNVDYSPAFGYTFSGDDYASVTAAVSSVIAQYKDTIGGGKENPDVILPEFIKALKAAGIDDVITANQEQYKAWKTSQK